MENNNKLDVIWKIEKRKVDDLIPYSKNPRKISEKQIEDLKKSIEKFGFVEIPVINRDNTIIAGHQRLKVMQLLGRGKEEIDVRIPEKEMTEKDFKEYCIRSNKNVADWDFNILDEFYEKKDLIEWGFEKQDLFFEQGIEETQGDDDIPATQEKIITIKDDLYELGNHRLLCGDSILIDDVERLMNSKNADMVFTDPPFNIGYTYNSYNDNKTNEEYYKFICDSLSPYIQENISYYIMQRHSNIFMQWKILEELKLEYKNLIIWKSPSQAQPNDRFSYMYQPILFFKKGNVIFNEYCQKRDMPEDYAGLNKGFKGKINDIWDDIKRIAVGAICSKETILSGKNKAHPAQMPIGLPERAILFSSNINNIIVDPFLGSGSTLIACEKTNRNCYGIEIDEKYCDVIVRRYIKFCKDNNIKFVIKRNGQEIDYQEFGI